MSYPTHFQRGCICRGTCMVDVISDGKSYRTFFGETLPAGRTVVCVCMCELGQDINAKRDEKWLFPVYDPELMILPGKTEPEKPVETISKRADAGWDSLPAYQPELYDPIGERE